jgi:hypothetical protein
MAREAKLNVQGLARQDKGLMSCMVPDSDRIFISIDMTAGEPSVTTHLTKDKMYRYANFDGIGKKPYYKQGVLMIDDIYLMYASVAPIFQEEVSKAFKESYPAGDFGTQWLKDPEVIKTRLKRVRKNAKWQALGFAYGLGPKKLKVQAYDNGFRMDDDQCLACYKAYWMLFKGIKEYQKVLSRAMEERGWLQNPFGFRYTCQPHTAFNYMIQSSVSSILNWFTSELFDRAPYAKFVTIIHDEVLCEVPVTKVEEFERLKEQVAADINAELNWTVDLRFGFAVGKNLYEAK